MLSQTIVAVLLQRCLGSHFNFHLSDEFSTKQHHLYDSASRILMCNCFSNIFVSHCFAHQNRFLTLESINLNSGWGISYTYLYVYYFMFVIVYCMLRLYNNKDHMVYVIYVLLYIKLGFATHFDYTGKINIVCFEEQ